MIKNDLTGKTFGELKVLKYTGTKKWRLAWYLCQCSCGCKIEIDSKRLVTGAKTHCGCKNTYPHRKHNGCGTRLYRIWKSMKARCYNKNNENYKLYGARGISICEEWMNDFVNFRDWAMLNGYNEYLTIDRIDNNGNYEPSNCRWVTVKVQSNNRRTNHLITYKNQTHTISEWSEILNIPQMVISGRLQQGWDINRTFTQKIRKSRKNPSVIPNAVL